MTQASDESTFGRGSDVSRRYRQLPVDSVPADLDRQILDHARAAVAVPAPSRRAWTRWGLPLGLVGTAVLAATLVLDSARRAPPLESAGQDPIATPQSAGPSLSAPVAGQSPAADDASLVPLRPAPTLQRQPAQAERLAGRNTSPTNFAARAAPAMAPAVSEARESQAAPLGADVAPGTGFAASVPSEPFLPTESASAAPAEASAASTSSASVAAPAPLETEPQSAFEGLDALKSSSLSPAKQAAAEERLEDIRYLRQTGRNRGADKAWRNFLKDFPNYPVAADDIARPRDE